MADFDEWAPYYDLIHQGLPGEAEFYLAQAVKRGGPVLEVGCGTGRIAIPLTMMGLDVVGLDNSHEMLAICQLKQSQMGAMPGTLTLVEADMRRFAFNKQFPLILMAYRTFMHCLTAEDQADCLACIYDHLTPGGELFLNVWAATPAALLMYPTTPREDDMQMLNPAMAPDGDTMLEHMYAAWRDDFKQLIHERHELREVDTEGAEIHRETLTMTRTWFSPREMEHLLYRAGFEIVAALGNFDGMPLGPDHKEMVWHVRKKSSV